MPKNQRETKREKYVDIAAIFEKVSGGVAVSRRGVFKLS